MNVGFWLCENNYVGIAPTASGCLDGPGFANALKCGGKLLLRPYYTGNPTPGWLANKIIEMDEYVSDAPNVAQDAVYYQVGNEPNLAHEGWQGGLDAYIEFFASVRDLVPLRIKLAWAGMSPGVPGYMDWYRSASLGADAVVAHVYGQTLPQLMNTTSHIMAGVHPLHLIIGECNFGPGAGIVVDRNAWATNVWSPFLEWVAQQARILFTLYFAYTWNADTPIGTPVDAKDTQIETVTVRHSMDPVLPVVKRRPEGRSWWIWYMAACGGVRGIIECCRRTQSTNVFIKGGDGPFVWAQATEAVVDELSAAGLNVYLWHYPYLGWEPDTVHGNSWRWTVQDEIECVRKMMEQGGPRVRGFISDPEAETEGQPDEAAVYANAVSGLLAGKWFGYAPLPVIDYHQQLPYTQFNAVCDAVMPQFYSLNLDGDPPWTLARLLEQWDRWMAAWKAAGQRVPEFTPVGEAYGVATANSMVRYEQLAANEEWSSWSYWSLQHAIEDNLVGPLADYVAQEGEGEAPPPTQTGLIKLTDADRQTLAGLLDSIYAGSEQVHALLAKPLYGPVGARTGYWAEFGLKSSVSQAKEICGMNT